MPSDPINPPHYNDLKIQPIDVIEAWGLDFPCGNVIKYLARAGRKTPKRLQDLKKSLWYLIRAVEECEREEGSTDGVR